MKHISIKKFPVAALIFFSLGCSLIAGAEYVGYPENSLEFEDQLFETPDGLKQVFLESQGRCIARRLHGVLRHSAYICFLIAVYSTISVRLRRIEARLEIQ